ncbi:hypothetical protein D1007_37325 [Hordeum vulgare]|nr:hypothetical protein D1007_37325 [Hordeum vulgare]
MLHIRDVEGPKKTGSVETRLEAMEQQVFKCQGMVERGLNANHKMITEFTRNHKMDAIDIGKHLSRLYGRVDQLQGQIYDLQNQNFDGREGSEEIGGENWGNCALGPEQEVSLLRYDDFKGEYVIIEDGEDIVDEIVRQEGWASLRADFFAELVDLNIDSKVGYVSSHLAMQKVDDDWDSQRHIVPIITDLTVIADGSNAHAEEGNVNVVDWNAVELEEPTDLVIAPIADTEMAKLFGIPVDDRDEKERDEANTSDNDDRELSDVDEQLMKDVVDDVDDAHDVELVHVYDKENPIIRVGKLWPNMDEFRLSFKTYAVRHQFDAKTVWTVRKKFYAKCRGFDGSGRRACKWRKLPSQPIVVEQSWPTKRARVSGSRRQTSQWMEQFGAASDEIEAVHTIETEAVHTVETVETGVVHTVETEAVHTVEAEADQTESAIEFHEVIASSPVKKTKMFSELVCAVQPKTRNAKAKKGTRRGRKR